ncbi:MAG: hypothetical protein H6Q93_570, partial [Nitrospirae bacterium]|nr:hypothetical protein [Nitrospirota bacterium]
SYLPWVPAPCRGLFFAHTVHIIYTIPADQQIVNYERACLIIISAKKPFFVAAL